MPSRDGNSPFLTCINFKGEKDPSAIFVQEFYICAANAYALWSTTEAEFTKSAFLRSLRMWQGSILANHKERSGIQCRHFPSSFSSHISKLRKWILHFQNSVNPRRIHSIIEFFITFAHAYVSSIFNEHVAACPQTVALTSTTRTVDLRVLRRVITSTMGPWCVPMCAGKDASVRAVMSSTAVDRVCCQRCVSPNTPSTEHISQKVSLGKNQKPMHHLARLNESSKLSLNRYLVWPTTFYNAPSCFRIYFV